MRPLIVTCTLALLLALAPAAAFAHPGGHGQEQAPVAPTSSESDDDGGSSALAIVGTVAGLLALGGLLAALKIRDSRSAKPASERSGLGALPRRRRIQIAVGGTAALLASAGLLLLFGPGGGEPNAPPNLSSMERVDGTLLVVEDRRLVLEPFEPLDGREEVEFEIREEDTRYFDIAHLRSHSSVALPTRLYYEKSGGRYFARYKEDAPANSSRAQ